MTSKCLLVITDFDYGWFIFDSKWSSRTRYENMSNTTLHECLRMVFDTMIRAQISILEVEKNGEIQVIDISNMSDQDITEKAIK
jgi:hypothetical protein